MELEEELEQEVQAKARGIQLQINRRSDATIARLETYRYHWGRREVQLQQDCQQAHVLYYAQMAQWGRAMLVQRQQSEPTEQSVAASRPTSCDGRERSRHRSRSRGESRRQEKIFLRDLQLRLENQEEATLRGQAAVVADCAAHEPAEGTLERRQAEARHFRWQPGTPTRYNGPELPNEGLREGDLCIIASRPTPQSSRSPPL